MSGGKLRNVQLMALRSRCAQHFCAWVKCAYTAASSLMTMPANVAGSSRAASVAASLCTPNNSSRAFSDRKAHTLLMLQLVSSACTTNEFASSVHNTSNCLCQ